MVFMMNSQILEHENRSTEREYFIYYILLCKLTTFLYWVPHFVQKCRGAARMPGGPETCAAQRNASVSGTPRSPRQAPALVWIRQVARLEEIL